MEAIKNFLKDIFGKIGNIFITLGELCTWLYDTLFTYINPLDKNFFGYAIIDGIIDGFSSLFADIGNILDYINPFSNNFFLKLALIPDMEDLIFDDVKTTLYNKFGFLSSIEENLDDFKTVFDEEDSKPNFNITLPAFLGSGTFSVIDFTFFDNYRSLIHGFIIAVSYYLFISKLYKKMPQIVKGG